MEYRMKETVYLKSNLHLYGVGSRVQFNVLEDFYINGIELSMYCLEQGAEMPTENLEMDYGKFLEDFKNKVVKVDGEVRVFNQDIA